MKKLVVKLMSKIKGLVLIGGKSKRMGSDKYNLIYHQKNQAEHCFELLTKYCEQVYYSFRQDQIFSNFTPNPGIVDSAQIDGPVAGLISAFNYDPTSSWFVLACDMPFVKDQEIKNLISKNDLTKFATAYISPYSKLPEPLCAIYNPMIRPILKGDIKCPRKILLNNLIHVKLVELEQNNFNSLDNINDPSDYKKSLIELRGQL